MGYINKKKMEADLKEQNIRSVEMPNWVMKHNYKISYFHFVFQIVFHNFRFN